MNWETLLSLGDSITIGSRSYMGYPDYAGVELERHTNKHWSVHNLAVGGYTTIDLSRHVTINYANLLGIRPKATSVLIGTNDVKTNTSVSNFHAAYDQLIVKTRLLHQESHMILIKIPLLRVGVSLPYTIEMNEVVRNYNRIIDDLATKHNIHTLSLELNDFHFFDGVHLNELGSQAAGLQLAEFLLQKRSIEIK